MKKLALIVSIAFITGLEAQLPVSNTQATPVGFVTLNVTHIGITNTYKIQWSGSFVHQCRLNISKKGNLPAQYNIWYNQAIPNNGTKILNFNKAGLNEIRVYCKDKKNRPVSTKKSVTVKSYQIKEIKKVKMQKPELKETTLIPKH